MAQMTLQTKWMVGIGTALTIAILTRKWWLPTTHSIIIKDVEWDAKRVRANIKSGDYGGDVLYDMDTNKSFAIPNGFVHSIISNKKYNMMQLYIDKQAGDKIGDPIMTKIIDFNKKKVFTQNY